MKKKLLILLLIISLCACSKKPSNNTTSEGSLIRYFDMIEMIQSYTNFHKSSEYFDISGDMSKINDGYRYYIFIDNPKIAMYDIEALAIERGVDYSNTMTANIGIFENEEYHMIPNQADLSLGYVKGLSISGTTNNPKATFYVLVQWKNKNRSITNRECYEVKINFEETKNDN